MPAEKENLEMTDVLNVIWKRKILVILFLLSALVLAFIFNMVVKPVYRSSVSLLLSKPRYNIDFYRTGEPKIETKPLPLESVEVLESLIKDGNLLTKVQASLAQKGPEFNRLTAKDLTGLVKIRMDKETGILELSFDYNDPQSAAVIADVWSGLLVDRIEDLSTKEVRGTAEFIKGKLAAAKDSLLQAEETFRQFDGKSALEMYQQQLNGKVNLVRAIEQQLGKYSILEHTVGEYLVKMSGEVAEKPEVKNERILANTLFLQNIVSELLVKNDTLQSTILEGLNGQIAVGGTGGVIAPQILQFEQSWSQDYNQQVVALTSLQKDIAGRAAFLKQYLQEVKNDIKTLKAKYSDENTKKIQLRRTVEVAKTTYTVLVQKNEEVGVAGGSIMGNLNIIKEPNVPFEPYSPNKRRNILVAAFIGLGFGCLAAFMKEGNHVK